MKFLLPFLLFVLLGLIDAVIAELGVNTMSVSKSAPDGSELIAGGINELVKKKEVKHHSGEGDTDVEDEMSDDKPPRTATGGVINTLLVVLCFLAFGGNLVFLVHVFYLKEKVVPLKLVHNINNEWSHQL